MSIEKRNPNGNRALAPAASYLSLGSTHASLVQVAQPSGSYGQSRAAPSPVSHFAAVSGPTNPPSAVKHPRSNDNDDDNSPVNPRQQKESR